ncbi:MAG: anthranilate phosphoribosyltransferase family protein [Chloroflexaceae bacterium]|nr:anthranilate phosphoribosyltransferase family protein [Chloroflexaceae bacterium]
MSTIFRELLKKIGSGEHTGKELTREEAALAARLMLLQEATPAQIGAFLIAHRIKRPTVAELVGMLDAYAQLGPRLEFKASPVVVMGNPYDGRSRTAPVTPITALILATAGVKVLMHGGDCMPTKYGVPLIEIWQGLGVDFSRLALSEVERSLQETNLGFIYLPRHFPAANGLVTYRDQIGKRPPLATLELAWSPSYDNTHIVFGYVHPPTEVLLRETLYRQGVRELTAVKGLEGSCDLARSRTSILGLGEERLHFHPNDYGFAGKDLPLESTGELLAQLQRAIAAQASELIPAAIMNGGFYLWRFGQCDTLAAGFAQAEAWLLNGQIADKLRQLTLCLQDFASDRQTANV